MFNEEILQMLGTGIMESLYMTLISTAMAYIIGVPIGVILYITGENAIRQNAVINKTLGTIVNILRSIPFLILLVEMLPLTRIIVGTTIGSTATIVPLVVAAAPFIARLVESSLKEVDSGVIEAAESMGSSPINIIFKVLLPEAKPSLILGSAIAVTTILGYSAMAGFVGGGGLGTIAINYGYYRYEYRIMNITVILLIIIVQVFQEVGTKIAFKSDNRMKK